MLKKHLIYIIFVVQVIFIIILQSFWPTASNYVSTFEGQKIQIQGEIVREPEVREFNQRITIKIVEIKTQTQKIWPKDERVLVYVGKFDQFEHGDQVLLEGEIRLPENFENDNQIEFDYVNYLGKDNVFGIVTYPKILEHNKSRSLFFKKIFQFKHKFLNKIKEIIPSPEAELLGGILLGVKSALGEKIETAFRRVGLIHIVVLSGYNVTIIAEAILAVLFFLPKIFSLFIGSIMIIIFSMMVGSGATVIRASIMAILALLARTSFRTYDVNRALFLAGSFMLWQNPKILFHDPSFQLSFLATLGLINLGNKMDKQIKFLPKKFGIKELTIATVSTQIAVLPLLIKMTGEVSIISVPVNIITLPIVPAVMLFGFLTGVFGLVPNIFFDVLARIFGALTYFGLHYILIVSQFFSDLSFATLKLPKLNFLTIATIYALVTSFFYLGPVQIGKKIINVLRFARRLIVKNK